MKKILLPIVGIVIVVTIIFVFRSDKNLPLGDKCLSCTIDTCSQECKIFLPRQDAKLAAFGSLKAFYRSEKIDLRQTEVGDTLEGQDATCDKLVIIEGDENITKPLVEHIQAGSNINSLDEEGRIVVNFYSSKIPMETLYTIKQSSEERPLKLDVFRFEYLSPGGAPACLPFIGIVSVN